MKLGQRHHGPRHVDKHGPTLRKRPIILGGETVATSRATPNACLLLALDPKGGTRGDGRDRDKTESSNPRGEEMASTMVAMEAPELGLEAAFSGRQCAQRMCDWWRGSPRVWMNNGGSPTALFAQKSSNCLLSLSSILMPTSSEVLLR